MNKKSNLTEALSKPNTVHTANTDVVDKVKEPQTTVKKKPRAGRVNKTNITGYFDKIVKWELQEIATERSRKLERRVTLQDLLAEALNDLFKKYGKAEVASSSGDENL